MGSGRVTEAGPAPPSRSQSAAGPGLGGSEAPITRGPALDPSRPRAPPSPSLPPPDDSKSHNKARPRPPGWAGPICGISALTEILAQRRGQVRWAPTRPHSGLSGLLFRVSDRQPAWPPPGTLALQQTHDEPESELSRGWGWGCLGCGLREVWGTITGRGFGIPRPREGLGSLGQEGWPRPRRLGGHPGLCAACGLPP